MKKYTVLFASMIIIATSCSKPGSPLEKPAIVFRGISDTIVVDRAAKDTVIMNLRYTIAVDKVGSSTTPTIVYLKDSRDQNVATYSLPDEIYTKLPDDQFNISGDITLKLPASTQFALRPDHPTGDTLNFEIYMEDKNGTGSNKVYSPNVYIVP
ncbi:MAG: hypothetical protein KDC07_01865 [Chitinophagaceae bacterium]|nr:hypothetical protein [Chitinophagaceae bacterium]MCB9045837.1 hypothetical protein [Chitinophagales bacterium]